MPRVLRRETFPFEYMTQVAVAVRTHDFDPAAVRIRPPLDGSVDLIVKAWPPAMRLEFILGSIQRRAAPTA